MLRVRLTLQGEVQGVNLRSEATAYARTHGLTGWIRNDGGGTVTLEVEAEPEALEAFMVWLKVSPRYAHVRQVMLEELPPRGDTGFRIVRWWHNIA